MADRIIKWMVVLPLFLTVACTGCGKSERRDLRQLELSTADTIAMLLGLYEGQFPNSRITNIAQAFSLLDLQEGGRRHPYNLQEQFRTFGKYSGFSDSFYEKYLCLPPNSGITNGSVKGEVVIVSAKPFPDLDESLCRIVIWKAGKQDYRVDTVDEKHIQQTIGYVIVASAENNIAPPVPKPARGDKVTYSAGTKVKIAFKELAEKYGLGRYFWFPVMVICGLVLLLIGVLLYIWFGHRGRH